MKYCIVLSFCFLLISVADLRGQNLHETKRVPSSKMAEIFDRVEDSLKRQFEKQHFQWPPASVYLRSFKYDRQLELWVRNSLTEPYRYFKTFQVCMQSGSMGPKRMEGDYQVPEGFYHINDFNPNSMYHLSLGLNYPNASDRILSDSLMPGSNIYIHGNCVSTGCIPLGDYPVEELYVIASAARSGGQEFIPVHVFPVRYSVRKSMDYLNGILLKNPGLEPFNKNIRSVYDYFESKKELPLILVNSKGEYVLN